jgi:hypothetical protein
MSKIIMDEPIFLVLSEPFEYGLEDNPSPLPAVLRCIKTIEGRQFGIIKTTLNYKATVYVHGFIINRYGGDDLKLSLIGNLQQLTVGASFIPKNHPAEKDLESCDFSIIPNPGGPATGTQIPWNEWKGFIGEVRV